MDPETAQLRELEAYLRREQSRLEAIEEPSTVQCLQLAAIELALLPSDVGVRLKRCRAIATRLLLTARRD